MLKKWPPSTNSRFLPELARDSRKSQHLARTNVRTQYCRLPFPFIPLSLGRSLVHPRYSNVARGPRRSPAWCSAVLLARGRDPQSLQAGTQPASGPAVSNAPRAGARENYELRCQATQRRDLGRDFGYQVLKHLSPARPLLFTIRCWCCSSRHPSLWHHHYQWTGCFPAPGTLQPLSPVSVKITNSWEWRTPPRSL
jgi:hypothetical protein